MSTVMEPRPAGAGAGPVSRPAYKVTGRRVLRSEWAKLWTLRSTWITLALGLAGLLVFGSIAAVRYKSLATSGGTRAGSGEFVNASAVALTLFGVRFGQLALGVLGVLVAAGEYGQGAPNIRRFCPWVWRLLREHQLSEFLGASGERDVEAVPAAWFSGDALGVNE
ncbi:hypothetical protein ONA91_37655 [Micromonospora sp. DR5-3]|uniref:hypothetical protein n=1 Tax=unclassified Micromonospora TaxID=2617518 RepID=UPI0011D6D7C8|nr:MULTISPECIES: hypothetical protein [unclassified Micromonospora]MCW3820171.1 hypothetical protein [Micromonospora sp. DR5-3]TYC20670.1 hypothetical protein FXF52_30185 [Micromonospora sp. MP36]